MTLQVTHRVADVRGWFRDLKSREEYTIDKTGVKLLEVLGATFIADEETVFAPVNRDYVSREIAWYDTQSLNVNDIPGGTPAAWKACASSQGLINSNYGYLIYNEKNGSQYKNVVDELKKHPQSRRALAIYTRPSMWQDYNCDGMSDFVCTNAVQYFIRNNKLTTIVQMRSNDLVWGYRNDYAWQREVQRRMADELSIEPGALLWHAGSLHVYERHFDYITP